jgi:hypothetical protein
MTTKNREEGKLMRLKMQTLFATALVLAGATLYQMVALPLGAAAPITSMYTATSGKGCRTIRTFKETGDSEWRCPGVAGYQLEVAEGDLRMNIQVVAPNGKKSDLNYWGVITSAFSSLGDKAEWRVQKINGKTIPIALIVRVNASENPEAPEKTTSYLAVAKITPGKTCVTDKIGPSATANEEARRAADSAANKRCLE